ncbi:MAG: M20/M25/M40 family metallo-hydrolase [Candidatus Lokiarchaeota archaeon]|nr:M20/M25/M40 family metallo-hydrolase [Candidatus Lokiarchaeota archaeon]
MNNDFTFKLGSKLELETKKFLQDYLKIDTSNPPGNEIKKAEFLYEKFQEEGLEGEILESKKKRGNFILKIEGSSPENSPSLLLLSHLDVVPADPETWKYPPFSGYFDGSFIWGRGAIDCANITISESMGLIKALRDGFKPKGNIILAATADEELGGAHGVIWLLKNYPEKIKTDFVLNEGVGVKLPLGESPQYLIQHAEKGVYWTRIIVKGTPAHASIPELGDNALLKMNEIIKKIKRYKTPVKITPAYRDMIKNLKFNWLIKKLLANKFTIGAVLWLLKFIMPELAQIFKALTRMTIVPTMLRSGTKENTIPERAELVLDVRTLPGQEREYLNFHLRHALGKKLYDEIEIEPILNEPGTRTEPGDILYKRIAETMNEIDPGAILVPFLVPGNSDSKEFKYLDIPTYGFSPMQEDPDMPIEEALTLAHGKNERISIKNLLLATEFIYRLVKKF